MRTGEAALKPELAKLFLCVAGLALAPAHALDGRVVDANRNPLPGVKLTWPALGLSETSDAEGRFHLGTVSPVFRPYRLPHAAGPAERIRADGRRARSESPWSPIFLIRPEARPARAPMAKTAPPSVLVAEKAGYVSARIQVPENASSLPDILLAPGQTVSPLPGQLSATPIFSAPTAHFESGTSTDLPNVYTDSEKVDPIGKPGSLIFAPYDSLNPGLSSTQLHEPSTLPMYVAVTWSLTTVPGATATILPYASVPESLGKPESSPRFRADDQGYFLAFIQEYYAFVPAGVRSKGPIHYGDSVTVLLKGPDAGNGYATMKWLQFTGPVRAAMEYITFGGGYWTRIYALHSGPVPPLDTCGRLSGRIDWKGAGAKPELWIGMLGTDLFAQADADGSFLTPDLPPGTLPLVVVAIGPDEHGIIRRTFYNLKGLAVSPGQTALLDPLEIGGP
jgi:hypothetical protein